MPQFKLLLPTISSNFTHHSANQFTMKFHTPQFRNMYPYKQLTIGFFERLQCKQLHNICLQCLEIFSWKSNFMIKNGLTLREIDLHGRLYGTHNDHILVVICRLGLKNNNILTTSHYTARKKYGILIRVNIARLTIHGQNNSYNLPKRDCFIQFKHILFAQMCKKDKTHVKQTYEVFSYIQ